MIRVYGIVALAALAWIAWRMVRPRRRGTYRVAEEGAAARPRRRPRRHPVRPDNDSGWVDLDRLSPIVRAREEQAERRMREAQLRRREAELEQRERELRSRERGLPPDPAGPATAAPSPSP